MFFFRFQSRDAPSTKHQHHRCPVPSQYPPPELAWPFTHLSVVYMGDIILAMLVTAGARTTLSCLPVQLTTLLWSSVGPYPTDEGLSKQGGRKKTAGVLLRLVWEDEVTPVCYIKTGKWTGRFGGLVWVLGCISTCGASVCIDCIDESASSPHYLVGQY